MSRVLTRRLINFKRVMRGKIKPLYCSKMVYLRLEGLKISDALISTILHSCPDIRFLILDKSKGSKRYRRKGSTISINFHNANLKLWGFEISAIPDRRCVNQFSSCRSD